MRVLIVEDEPAFALMVEDIAMAEGFEIAGIARNTAEAMELAPEADIAILDVRLADGLTGPEIARHLVEHFNVGIVYLTGNPDLVGDRDGVHVVVKPPSVPSVVDGLRQAAAWHSRRARQQNAQDGAGNVTPNRNSTDRSIS
ncbi:MULTISPECIES: response regulator [unclassified Rhizobium]|jgi:DNA-binding response OmpR family regulator|uniref:response regulator n=1 Tax=unclassified Rhizobium TaxID=2613769 RepID=UPI000DD6FDC6|nr:MULTISPECIES: response regulator [unclassified Rhizobium]MDM9646162.1 response regulator [Rhizobium sp. S163]